MFPPEATAAIHYYSYWSFSLNHCSVPWVRRCRKETAQKELDHVRSGWGAEMRHPGQRGNGNLTRLSAFIERQRWLKEQLGLRSVRLELFDLVRRSEKSSSPAALLARQRKERRKFRLIRVILLSFGGRSHPWFFSMRNLMARCNFRRYFGGAFEVLCEQIPGSV